MELFDCHDFAVAQVEAFIDHPEGTLPNVLAAPPLPAHDPVQVVVPALVSASMLVMMMVMVVVRVHFQR